MLNIIYGRAATGKTTLMLRQIESCAKEGKKIIYIVPEQFTFESERAVLTILGDSLSRNVTVLSFTGLAEALTSICGGGARGVLTDADKILFMNKTLLSLKDELYIWRKYLSSPGFASKVVDMIGEFKISALFPDDLKAASIRLTESALKEKIKALSLVYRTYDAMLSGRFIDPADKLDKLYNDLTLHKFFENKTVFIDGFKGFTGQQYRIIDLIMAQCDSLTVTALCDNIEEEKMDIYYNTTAAVSKIREIAKRHRVPLGSSQHLTEPYYGTKDMKCVENVLSGNGVNGEASGENVAFCVAKSVADEVHFTARNIRRLVREKGYRYRDFVIIARNPENYEAAIEREFAAHDISCFFDKRIPLTVSPLFSFVDAALGCIKNFDSEEIFRFVKTGLSCSLTTEEISELENYVFLWNITAGDWNKYWDMDPTGFSQTDINREEEIKETLCRIDSLKHKAIDPIIKFRRDFVGTVKDMAEAVVKLLDFCSAADKMGGLLEFMSSDFSSEDIDALRQSWDLIMNVLDGIVRCFGDDTVSNEQFRDMFRISCEMTTVGRIPQMLDEVTFGAADRIRPSRPKVAFILGANQGVFPQFPENNSILGNSDRRILINEGLEVRNKTVFQAVEENLLVYSCVCCPSEMLFVTCNQTGADGSVSEPAGFFSELLNAVKGARVYYEPEDCLEENSYPETAESAFRTLCDFAGNNKKGTATLMEAVLTNQDKKQEFARIIHASANYQKQLSEDRAKELFGKNIPISATRFDTYHGCHFKYFCRYGLKTSIIQPAKLDVMQRGTIVHYVLEQFCNAHLQDIEAVSQSQIEEETKKYIEEYFSAVRGSSFLFTARFKFLLKKIAEGIVEVIGRIVAEFAQSSFRPEKCEVSIGENGTIPTVVFPFGKDSKLSLYGSIDRLDTWGSYVRIVDYKTGSKTFRLSDTLYGLNLQMLLYLYCVIRGRNKDYHGKNPAGILYLPSKKDIKKTGLAMNGILCANEDVALAMEKENAGEFIPKFKINKDGSPSKSNTSFIPEEAFDTIFDHIERLAANMGEELHKGNISVDPIESGNDSACKYCDYKTVCLREDEECRRAEKYSNSEILERMRGGDDGEI